MTWLRKGTIKVRIYDKDMEQVLVSVPELVYSAFFGTPTSRVYHKNGNLLDNRPENLSLTGVYGRTQEECDAIDDPTVERWEKRRVNGVTYFVSTFGRYRLYRNKVDVPLTRLPDPDGIYVGYPRTPGKLMMTRLDLIIADTFLVKYGPEFKLIHLDGDQSNCRVDNLKWVRS